MDTRDHEPLQSCKTGLARTGKIENDSTVYLTGLVLMDVSPEVLLCHLETCRRICNMLDSLVLFNLIGQVWTFNWPAPTGPASNEFSIDSGRPTPTSEVGLVEKRQGPISTICGYVDGDPCRSYAK